MQPNMIHCGDSAQLLKQLPAGCIDLTITSPPYDNARDYNGYSFDFEAIVAELYRVTKAGGVVVWIVNDTMQKGSESGTSFMQALHFMAAGFKLHDTMIYAKNNPMPNAGKRYQQCFEYMFVFSKGTPVTTNILTRPRKEQRKNPRTKTYTRGKDGAFNVSRQSLQQVEVPRENIWFYNVGGGHSTQDKIAFQHPAIFPEQLAADHILSWSNEGELVLDCFGGSGTVAKMARKHKRNFIHIDTSAAYCEIAQQRLALGEDEAA